MPDPRATREALTTFLADLGITYDPTAASNIAAMDKAVAILAEPSARTWGHTEALRIVSGGMGGQHYAQVLAAPIGALSARAAEALVRVLRREREDGKAEGRRDAIQRPWIR